jgi:proteasome alpha subunit
LKGFAYSREDVTARSLANTYSQALGTIFSQELKPLEVEILVVGVGSSGQPNEIYRISFDGSIIDERGYAVIGGRAEVLQGFLKDRVPGTLPSLGQALSLSLSALESGSTQKLAPESLEVAVLDRTRDGRKFRRIPVQDVKRLLAT